MTAAEHALEHRGIQVVASVFLVMACLARFVALEFSPPGFYVDEAMGATHILCVAEQGTGADEAPFPLFFRTASYSYPPFVYFSAAWVKVFGHSIHSLRAVAAFFNLLTLLGLYLIGRLFLDRTGALLIGLAGALSPWAFQFARIAWDPAVAPCFAVWSCYFFLRSSTLRDAVLAGAMASLAGYSYPPARLAVPLILLAPFVFKVRERQYRFIAVAASSCLILSVPLVHGIVFGELLARFNSLNIFSSAYLSRHYGTPSFVYGMFELVRNLLFHLNPRFLFISGDFNVRHSTGWVGELSWIDITALVLGVAVLLRRREGRPVMNIPKQWRLFIAMGIVASLLPAAIASDNHEKPVHALRAILVWPFLAMFTGMTLRKCLEQMKGLHVFLGVLLAVYMAYFGWAYFARYPVESRSWFDADVADSARDAARTGDWDAFVTRHQDYPGLAVRYYLMHYAGDSCAGSARRLQKSRV